MLNGLLEKSDGRAEVHGEDVFDNVEYLRANLGVCPQHDILFNALTPEDHLKLFAIFKGTEPDKVNEQVKQMLIDLDL